MILLDQNIYFLQWPLLAGIAGSMIHVFTGPDHLAAVMPFAVEHKKSSWKIGISWGTGHLVGMLLIGVLIMIFKQLIPFEQISAYSEFFVGFVLVGIGVWAIYRIRKSKPEHQHPHYHAETDEFHIHPHSHSHSVKPVHSHSHSDEVSVNKGVIGSFTVGVIHGFAGVAHFILFLPMLGFNSVSQSVSYIAGFGIGTLSAMTFFAVVVGLLSSKSKKSTFKNAFLYLRYTAALLALVVGFYWIFAN
jgi:ABC-type nickel/cobalt efflux system permease component RcnA